MTIPIPRLMLKFEWTQRNKHMFLEGLFLGMNAWEFPPTKNTPFPPVIRKQP